MSSAGELPRQTEVLVVGAGVVGLCAAHYLAELGREVVVVDRGPAFSGTSHGNAGLVPPSHCIPLPAPGVIRQGIAWMLDPTSPFYVKPRLDRDLAAWLVRFALASRARRSEAGITVLRDLLLRSAELFEELSAHPELEFAYHGDGVLNVYASEPGLEAGLVEAERLQRYGLGSRRLDPKGLAEFEPTLVEGLAGGVHWPQDGHLDPSLFVRQLGAALQRRGVRILWETELLSLGAERGRAGTPRTTAGPIAAEEVVLAAGAWSPAFSRELGLRLPIQAAKGYSITAAVPGPLPRRPLLFVDAKVVATPLGERLRLAGTLELAGLDTGISQRRVETIRTVGERYLPGVGLGPEGQVWRGLRPLCADGLPIVGRAPGLANVTLATGHGHLGLSLAPVSGQIVAELLAGRDRVHDMRPLSPERF